MLDTLLVKAGAHFTTGSVSCNEDEQHVKRIIEKSIGAWSLGDAAAGSHNHHNHQLLGGFNCWMVSTWSQVESSQHLTTSHFFFGSCFGKLAPPINHDPIIHGLGTKLVPSVFAWFSPFFWWSQSRARFFSAGFEKVNEKVQELMIAWVATMVKAAMGPWDYSKWDGWQWNAGHGWGDFLGDFLVWSCFV